MLWDGVLYPPEVYREVVTQWILSPHPKVLPSRAAATTPGPSIGVYCMYAYTDGLVVEGTTPMV